ncbi:uncharacterized protein LOC120944337 [Rana temporaria]|uniref:uncharacterized protein LOC120944337 n=1 Tax=Rana temporaria TaxID=8407 RepID=UPI001AAC5E07|nr:uncharacterized protein LOC120944337 [Rana temporaria]
MLNSKDVLIMKVVKPSRRSSGIVQFVKHHALDLIREVALVDPILYDLMSQKLITKDQYDKLCSNTTSQKKMRELYKFVSGWSDGRNVTFYDSLLKHNKKLIKYLEHQDKLPTPHKEHFVDRHQQELIKGMTSMMELILPHLRKERLLKKDQFHKISTEATPKEKMEMLYYYIKTWDITHKDIFYDILKKLNCQIISRLEEKDKKKPLKPTFSKHFVDRHHQDLINWVYVLQPILDSLLKQHLLSKEQYESICSKINSQEKMRDLYNVVRGWGDGDKDTLYNALGNHNRLLIRDLEYQDMEWPLPSRTFSMSLNQSKWTHKHLLLYTLEYLLLEELKHFTKKLSNFTYKDRPTLQFGMLENEDSTSLSDKLINHYGEFTALDVTNQVLKSISLNRFAVELQDGIHLCGLRRPEVILTFIMDELEQFDFRLFKDKLFELHKEDKHPIPKRLVDCADRITTTDLLIWIYGEKEAMLVTVQILCKLYSFERSEKVERLTRDLENWIVTQGINKQDFREGEVAASKVTVESFAPQPGSSQDFDFQVLEKANLDQSEPNSASQTGPKHQVSSKEENTQSCRMTFDLKNEMKCSVCLEVFTDPTTLMCGHNFCMKCIEKSWNSQSQGKYTCPNCKHKFEDKPKLKVNCALREVARIIKPRWSKPKNGEMNCTYCTETTEDAVKSCLLCEALLCNIHLNVHSKEKEHILIEPTTSFKERKCSIHNKVLEHYCIDDDVCVCSLCCIYGEHKGHQVEKVTKAAEKKKNDLRNVQKELTCKEKNIEELLKCCGEAQAASDTELFHKLLEVLELKVPGDTSIQEGWSLFSVPDLIQKAEKRKNQLSQKIDNIKKCQEMDPILFLQDQKKERVNKSFQSQTVDASETFPKETSNSSSRVDDVDWDPCEQSDDPEKMHLTSSFSESFQSNEDVLDMSTGGYVSSPFEGRNHDDTLNSYPGGSLHSIDLDNLSEEISVSSSDSVIVDWSTVEEDNDSDKNLLSCSRESLQSQRHALSLSEESSISSHLDDVDCDLCGKDHDPDDILIVPEINGNTYKLELKSAGLFRCSKTGIKFQVRHPVTMEYELESWYEYMEFLRYQGSEVVGPLFNIKTPQEPDIVSAVYLPHYVCLKELSEGTSRIICAHFKDGNLSVEKPARILPFHVVLENPSFSPLGTLWHYLPDMLTKHIPIHGKVLLYFRVVGKNHVQYQIHLYLVPIFTTMSQDLEKSKENNGFEKIDKPSRTTSRIYTEKKFIVRGSTITHVMPTELEMLSISPLDNFVDIIINAPVDIIELCLVQKDSEENVWGCLMSTGEIEMLQPTIPKLKRPKEEMDMEDEQQGQPSKKAKQVSLPRSLSELLLNTLQKIPEKKFEEFKKCLTDEEFLIRNQYDSMRTSELENKDRMEVSGLLIRRYTTEKALPITFLVLDRIGEKQLAKNLRPCLDAKTLNDIDATIL